MLKAPDETQEGACIQKEPLAAVWLDAVTAESEARKTAGDEWHSQLHIAFGKDAGLLENDVSWVVRLLHEYAMKGEIIPLLKWPKEQRKSYVSCLAPVSVHLERKMKVRLSFLYLSVAI